MATLAVLSLVAVSIAMTYSFIQAKYTTRTVKSALAREMTQRERSDATLAVATNVLNDIYDELVPTDLQSFDTTADFSTNQPSQASPALSNEMVAVLDNLLEFYDQLAEQGGDNHELMLSSATALGRVADIYRQIGEPQEALTHYADALNKLEELKTQFPSDQNQDIQRARIYNEIGLMHHIEGRQDKAIDSHSQALELLKSIESSDLIGDLKLIYEMARANYLLGRPKERDASNVALDHLQAGPLRRGPRGGPDGGPRGRPDSGQGGRPDGGPREGPGFGPFRLPPWLNGFTDSLELRRQHEYLSDAIKTLERLPVEDQGPAAISVPACLLLPRVVRPGRKSDPE